MAIISLTKGLHTLTDDSDYEWLSQWKWHSHGSRGVYVAARTEPGKIIFMHREILQAPPNTQVDHINHDTLDNRRTNLRLCTLTQNIRNKRGNKDSTSQYKGVCWHKREQCWHAGLRINGRRFHLGSYRIEEDAARAYDKEARKQFGEFAYLNFPDE